MFGNIIVKIRYVAYITLHDWIWVRSDFVSSTLYDPFYYPSILTRFGPV